MADVKIVNQETLSNSKYRLELFEIETTQNGQTETQKREIYFRPAATTILLHDPERKTVLLTRQFRLPVYLSRKRPELIIEACAGLIDDGELPEHAIVREVEEETGYRISEIRQIAEGFSSPASFMEYVYFFTGIYSQDLKVNEGGGKKKKENI
ncbi:NUDIX domain-containing protein [Arcticibacter sp. MXS-1]|uniref:NUDIX domain-containing protein n=1 Tax=Arcticibacter sp. MXS-1 TaxID=3341726 RepID=UPI0035A8E926